jgi:hypothetical protein
LFFKQTYRLCDIRNIGILDLYQGTTKLIDGIPVETLLVKRYQRGNRNPYTEQTTQWSKEKKYKRTNNDQQNIHINDAKINNYLILLTV